MIVVSQGLNLVVVLLSMVREKCKPGSFISFDQGSNPITWYLKFLKTGLLTDLPDHSNGKQG